jgi:hypothetical protein
VEWRRYGHVPVPGQATLPLHIWAQLIMLPQPSAAVPVHFVPVPPVPPHAVAIVSQHLPPAPPEQAVPVAQTPEQSMFPPHVSLVVVLQPLPAAPVPQPLACVFGVQHIVLKQTAVPPPQTVRLQVR